MKDRYYHGSPDFIESTVLLDQGTCVTSSKANALSFAQRRKKKDAPSYIYSVLLDPATDIERRTDPAGVVDRVLVRATPFEERILVTDALKVECKAEVDALKP